MPTMPVDYFIEIAGQRFQALEVSGEEGLSRTGFFEVKFHIPPDDGLDPEATTSQEATLVIRRDGGEVRRIKRIAVQTVRNATKKGNHGTSLVTVRLEPKLATLRHRVDIRVYRDKTANQIAAEVLTDLGVAVEQRLAGSYTSRAYCVQMRESDLDFAQRLLEDDGIGYFIDDDDTVVFFDNTDAYEPTIGTLPFAPDTGMEREADTIYQVGYRGEVTPGKVSLRDFNHEHPSLDQDVSAPGAWDAGPEWYDYPGEYKLPPEGQVKANWRSEALAAASESLLARTYSPSVRLAVQFVLLGAPIGVTDGPYIVRSVKHAWNRDKEGFAVEIEAHAASVLFRPLVTTPIPRLLNPLSGYATGPAGEDIHTDKWGQCKVHFPWDRRQPKDDRCSDWIPVLQDNTGHSVGIARVGWELMCHFLEGDPDRPAVVGRVFNPEDPYPEILPMHKTKTALRSLTSPRPEDHGEAALLRNEIRFEDMIGNEAIDIVARKDQNVVVGNDKVERINDIQSAKVQRDETISIGEEHHEDVIKRVGSIVNGNQTVKVGASRSFEVGGSQSEEYGQNHTHTIGGSHFRRIGDTDAQSADKTFKETIGGVVLEASVKTNDISGEEISAMTVGGAILEVAKMNKTEGTGKLRVDMVGGLSFIKAGEEIAARINEKRTTFVGATMTVEALKNVALSGAEKLLAKALGAKMDGSKVLTLRVGETEIILRDGVLSLKSKTDIAMVSTGANNQGVGEAKQIG